MLEDLDRKLNADGVSLVFAEMKTPVRRKVERYALTATIDPDHFFDTIDEAVHAYQRRAGADRVSKPDSSWSPRAHRVRRPRTSAPRR
jgi:hypothetical protein